jgi:tryptophan synthase alpha chain
MFAEARAGGRAALLPYLTAGLPTPAASPGLFAAMAEAGADGFEVGIPYSDPLMDGPVIQNAGERALAAGTDIDATFRIIGSVTTETGKPVLVMTYINPVLRAGVEAFVDRLAAAGAAGLIVVDLPVDEGERVREVTDAAGLGTVLFAAPTITDSRLRRVAAARPSFVYGIAEMGVTGERTDGGHRIHDLAGRIRAATDAPLVLGVGISTPSQVAAAASVADGVIVGSALVRSVLEASSPQAAEVALRTAVADLVAATARH